MSNLSFLKDKNVVVTGGAGFLGSHLCDRLIKEGAKVIAIDNFITGNKKNIEHLQNNTRFSFIEADVSTAPETYLPSEYKPDVIFHFASPASPPRYQEKPVETYLVNSIGTHNLLQYLLSVNPAGRLIFASTSEVYGDPQVHPQTETYWGNVNPNGVRSCYDEAKRVGETICGVHERDFEMDVRIVRIFNTYGPRIDLKDGRVIPNFIQQVLADQPLTIYGEGTQTRSYCYVEDLIEGIVRLGAYDNLKGQTVNIGNPVEFTMMEAAKIVNEVTGKNLQLEFKPLPKDDPTRRKPDISKAKELLQWEPTIDFQTGFQKTLEYFSN
jgi:nucleoside-diphosphate-sugar epimerase